MRHAIAVVLLGILCVTSYAQEEVTYKVTVFKDGSVASEEMIDAAPVAIHRESLSEWIEERWQRFLMVGGSLAILPVGVWLFTTGRVVLSYSCLTISFCIDLIAAYLHTLYLGLQLPFGL